jgi:hypothetical protein
MDIKKNEKNKNSDEKDLVFGLSLFANNQTIDQTEYFDRCILNFMIKQNQLGKIDNEKEKEKSLKKYIS